MAMNNQDILFASLLNSNIVTALPRFNVVQNELQKHVLPGIPYLPFKNEDKVEAAASERFENLYRADAPIPEERQFFPLSFSIDEGDTWFLMPYECMVSINGKNIVTKRSVAKGNKLPGKIKERWNQDDYEITITGVLIGALERGSVEDCFPIEDFEKLKQVLTHAREVRVKSTPFELCGIHKIVIEDFSFPFTKGENVQAYDIKAVSDFDYELIVPFEEE